LRIRLGKRGDEYINSQEYINILTHGDVSFALAPDGQHQGTSVHFIISVHLQHWQINVEVDSILVQLRPVVNKKNHAVINNSWQFPTD